LIIAQRDHHGHGGSSRHFRAYAIIIVQHAGGPVPGQVQTRNIDDQFGKIHIHHAFTFPNHFSTDGANARNLIDSIPGVFGHIDDPLQDGFPIFGYLGHRRFQGSGKKMRDLRWRDHRHGHAQSDVVDPLAVDEQHRSLCERT